MGDAGQTLLGTAEPILRLRVRKAELGGLGKGKAGA